MPDRVPAVLHCKWRVDRKLGRTIYAQIDAEPSDADLLIGVMDSPTIASVIVRDHNAELERRQIREGWSGLDEKA
jgi:hypothetical protein